MTKMIQLKLIFLISIFHVNSFIVTGLSISESYQRQEMLRDCGFLDLEAERLVLALANHNYENLFRLLNDPKVNINGMHDERSLLHYMAYRYRDIIPEEREALRILLNRPDLQIDKKGNGIGDRGCTVLEMQVGFLIRLHDNSRFYNDSSEINNELRLVETLLAKGANPELISVETKNKFKSTFNTEIHQLNKFLQQRLYGSK
ncbi:MAG TPA: hypothetical protein VLG50_00270 [Candidatus Saccharimonadales bacterium]|nr:hypothetical protein [Candidatus Saccharimonadales bacterium]